MNYSHPIVYTGTTPIYDCYSAVGTATGSSFKMTTNAAGTSVSGAMNCHQTLLISSQRSSPAPPPLMLMGTAVLRENVLAVHAAKNVASHSSLSMWRTGSEMSTSHISCLTMSTSPSKESPVMELRRQSPPRSLTGW